MLDWLRRKIGCVSSHEEMTHSGVSENNINRFKVLTDPSLTTENNLGVKSGILEVNDDELVHYQNNSEPIRWSYRCLRRYGMGNDTFLFESGRRCTTGPGLFAFKCRRADILHNVFTEKLKLFASNPNGNMDSLHRSRQSDFPLNSPPTLNRYSEDVMLSSNSPAAHMVVEEPYMTPISTNQSLYINGGLMSDLPGYGQLTADNGYVNTNSAPALTYVNTVQQVTVPNPLFTQQSNGTARVTEMGSVSSNGNRLPAIREINYADLDLPRSDAIGFNQVPRKPKTQPMTPNFHYVNLGNSSSDEDDEAFLPTVIEIARPPSAPTVENASSTHYTTIDFQKTEAIANTTKSSSQAESTQEGVRKTRHDSSADDLH